MVVNACSYSNRLSERIRMTKKYLSVIISLGSICFLLCTPKSPTAPAPSKTTVDQLEISDAAVSGWAKSTANADTFCTYPIDSFYCCAPGSVDGGAVPYDSSGCKEIAYQTLTGPSPMIYTSYAMDFVTIAKASAMFGISKSSQIPNVAIPGFDISIAFAKSITNGVIVYAHFNKFYIEITLLGYTDDAAALDPASKFLGVFKEKIK
jgi:hypothetical protein